MANGKWQMIKYYPLLTSFSKSNNKARKKTRYHGSIENDDFNLSYAPGLSISTKQKIIENRMERKLNRELFDFLNRFKSLTV